ncbi:MAG: hypothetical protein ACREM1_13615 [Longimicrobiales bacterium]
MPDWVVWLIVGFIVFKFMSAGGACQRRVSKGGGRLDHAGGGELGGGRPTPVAMRRGPDARAGRNAETPIQAAQRRFVEGATTVEEYEAELDRVLRERSVFRAGTVTETAPRTSRI